MTWTIRFTASAAKALRKLDPEIRRRVRAALELLAQEPERGKPLQLTLKGLRSWRTGDFRIVYRIKADRVVVLIIAVGHRRDVYSRLRERL
jgi:mRNA interferase RelE/StbE